MKLHDHLFTFVCPYLLREVGIAETFLFTEHIQGYILQKPREGHVDSLRKEIEG